MYFDLSSKQILILEFIKEQIALKGYPPSVRETCLAVGLKSTSTVHSHLNKLEKLGYIRRDPTKPRAIEVLDQNKYQPDYGHMPEILQLPLVGQITAGAPILAKQNIEEYISLPANLVKGTNNFVLKVKGDSMVNAGILNGDYVIVDKKHSASNSEIVAALIHKEYATVKRFEKDGDVITLKPENDFMEPIVLTSKDVEIIGIVTGVFRVL
ncbi:transcriptional repressor LexA [Romboutsia lituseburensis]|uniref:LexA repressor n=1 Tax=Romboutsia lituseburensis DSM 797 TaxID=1121325 RepID=A0A1G9N199_9FIRM|nr:transcriptional repressor LexA [Romboutsia lituseburensis]CEH34245.1 LexA repressor [Romboutsia lituseburensis]SDL79907.1 SOS-response transcriptional repressor, LexA [Romboutsia lituseburensis DSM 797]